MGITKIFIFRLKNIVGENVVEQKNKNESVFCFKIVGKLAFEMLSLL